MARNRTSFSAAAGLFNSEEAQTPKAPPLEPESPLKAPTEGVRGTQGRKGQKARRMNVPVTDEEYEAILAQRRIDADLAAKAIQ